MPLMVINQIVRESNGSINEAESVSTGYVQAAPGVLASGTTALGDSLIADALSRSAVSAQTNEPDTDEPDTDESEQPADLETDVSSSSCFAERL